MLQNSRPAAVGIAGVLTGLFVAVAVAGCASLREELGDTPDPAAGRGSELTVVPYEEVRWGALNPARGDAGPRAGDLWGDRTATDATGFLVRFAEGFSSPPHIHNTTYRGIVIEGLVHNDDPGAVESWMPPGSYWTQPAGEVHVTSAKGEGGVAYIEIQHGPYLVMPSEEATDNGERAINVHADNLVWLDASTTRLIRLSSNISAADGPRIAFLWGDPQNDQPGGSLISLPAKYTSTLTSAGSSVRVVVIKGTAALHGTGAAGETLRPGSYVGASGDSGVAMTWSTADPTWLYVRSAAPVEITVEPID